MGRKRECFTECLGSFSLRHKESAELRWYSVPKAPSRLLRVAIQMSLQLEMTFLEQCSPQSTLDLCVPQAIDQWVQHRLKKL